MDAHGRTEDPSKHQQLMDAAYKRIFREGVEVQGLGLRVDEEGESSVLYNTDNISSRGAGGRRICKSPAKIRTVMAATHPRCRPR